MFEDTLPHWFRHPNSIKTVQLVHIDCDLYSSTKTVLENISRKLTPGTVVVFDEWWGYPGCEEHEQRAWKEFVEDTAIQWEVIGFGIQQWGIRIA